MVVSRERCDGRRQDERPGMCGRVSRGVSSHPIDHRASSVQHAVAGAHLRPQASVWSAGGRAGATRIWSCWLLLRSSKDLKSVTVSALSGSQGEPERRGRSVGGGFHHKISKKWFILHKGLKREGFQGAAFLSAQSSRSGRCSRGRLRGPELNCRVISYIPSRVASAQNNISENRQNHTTSLPNETARAAHLTHRTRPGRGLVATPQTARDPTARAPDGTEPGTELDTTI